MEFIILFYLLLIIAGVIEYYLHKKKLNNIPHRIHVNGIRGKSSTTRLIYGGLKEAGYDVMAKTTGTEPRLIYETGEEKEILRLGIARIIEQLRIIFKVSRYNPDVLVLECMAISPEMQWVSENKIVESTIGVITNVRHDHEEKMGETLGEIASTLALTIPEAGDLVTAEKNKLPKLKEDAQRKNTKVHFAKIEEEVNLKEYFNYPVFNENVVCALKVCNLLGVDIETALSGMAKANPDPGALKFFKIDINHNSIYFVNAFAANDFESTKKAWNTWQEWYNTENYDDLPLIGIFNSRFDRGDRFYTLDKIMDNISFEQVFITGYIPSYIISKIIEDKTKIKKAQLKDTEKFLRKILDVYEADILIFGFGNTKKYGLEIIEFFQENGEEL